MSSRAQNETDRFNSQNHKCNSPKKKDKRKGRLYKTLYILRHFLDVFGETPSWTWNDQILCFLDYMSAWRQRFLSANIFEIERIVKVLQKQEVTFEMTPLLLWSLPLPSPWPSPKLPQGTELTKRWEQKRHFILPQFIKPSLRIFLLCEYSSLLTGNMEANASKTFLQTPLNLREERKVQRYAFTFSTMLNSGDFTLLFWRGRKRNVPKCRCIMHKQKGFCCSLHVLLCGDTAFISVSCCLIISWRCTISNQKEITTFLRRINVIVLSLFRQHRLWWR